MTSVQHEISQTSEPSESDTPAKDEEVYQGLTLILGDPKSTQTEEVLYPPLTEDEREEAIQRSIRAAGSAAISSQTMSEAGQKIPDRVAMARRIMDSAQIPKRIL